ncbi:MAG: undecaprenyldiphospho-muramoylpentapeptide beta-N-acetylglucosaminyltransferase [Desulfobacteraceae bacterium]|jgi:UDP-N-acetylglucosamine--N-acetylmuramyl-(pentapeptide) pyrophosphoryl-undecaprenol N-acetylglucosamine transferase
MQKKVKASRSDDGYRMVVAGGGTGGHLFPGIAIAQAFKSRLEKNSVLFVNAGRPLERKVLSELGWDQKAISIEGIKGRGRWHQIRAAIMIPGAIWRAWRILKNFKADVVLSVGGYSAGPVAVAASLLGVTTVLHEQNRLPGVTNRILGRVVDRIYLSFEESREYFDPDKIKVTGNPVRDEILALATQCAEPANGDLFTVLVVGGSQGAHAINQAVVDALHELKDVDGLRFVHQTGPEDKAAIEAAYDQTGVPATVQPFFHDMARLYKAADMVICRAGATTVAEITVIGKAAVFVPFPFAADDHQTLNAQALSDAGAAEMIAQDDLSGSVLAKLIKGYRENRILLTEMGAKARALGRPGAASVIVDDIFELLTK